MTLGHIHYKIQVLSKKGNRIGQYFKLYKRKTVDNLCGLHCFVLPKYDKARQYKKSFKAIKSMRSDRILSKIYLKINNGYGDFYDVKISTDGEKWDDAYFSEERITPSILASAGIYKVQFSIKSRKGVSAYHSKKGPFFAEINVKPFRDTMLVFDDDTLASWQEDYEGWKANE